MVKGEVIVRVHAFVRPGRTTTFSYHPKCAPPQGKFVVLMVDPRKPGDGAQTRLKPWEWPTPSP